MNPSASAAAAGGIERLGLGTEVRELKFGSSFKNGGRGSSFHTIRYDFKPASVDTTKPAALEVGVNNQVTVSVPNSDGNGTNVFKGPRKPYTKECVLIIDNETGEVTLEKLTHNIQMKKTRPEKPERPSPTPAGKPSTSQSTPITESENKKGKPSSSLSIQSSSSNAGLLKDSSSPSSHNKHSKINEKEKSKSLLAPPLNPSLNHLKNRPQSPLISVPARHSPLGPSPGHISPSGNGNFSGNPSPLSHESSSSRHSYNNNHHPNLPTMPGMPSLFNNDEDFTSSPRMDSGLAKSSNSRSSVSPRNISGKDGESSPSNRGSITQMPSLQTSESKVAAGNLSEESSSGDSSSSSSSSDDDSSDEDMEEVADDIPVPGAVFRQPQEVRSSNKKAIPSDQAQNSRPHQFNHNANQQHHRSFGGNMPLSMPSHLLSEDLQLSETGSDSD